MENVLPRSLDLFTNSISVTAFKESTQNAWLWVTLCMIGIYFFDGDGRVWLVGLIFTGGEGGGGGFKWWGRGYNRLRFQSGYKVPVFCYRPSKSWKISGTLNMFLVGCKLKFVLVTRTSLNITITMDTCIWKWVGCPCHCF